MDYRAEFSKWWLTEFKTIKFPSQGTVFDYYIDPETKKFEPWSKLIPQFEFDPEMPLQVSVAEQPMTGILPRGSAAHFSGKLPLVRKCLTLLGTCGPQLHAFSNYSYNEATGSPKDSKQIPNHLASREEEMVGREDSVIHWRGHRDKEESSR